MAAFAMGSSALGGAASPRAGGAPVGAGGFQNFMDAARQQTDFIAWMATAVQEHEKKIDRLIATMPVAGQTAAPAWRSQRRKEGVEHAPAQPGVDTGLDEEGVVAAARATPGADDPESANHNLSSAGAAAAVGAGQALEAAAEASRQRTNSATSQDTSSSAARRLPSPIRMSSSAGSRKRRDSGDGRVGRKGSADAVASGGSRGKDGAWVSGVNAVEDRLEQRMEQLANYFQQELARVEQTARDLAYEALQVAQVAHSPAAAAAVAAEAEAAAATPRTAGAAAGAAAVQGAQQEEAAARHRREADGGRVGSTYPGGAAASPSRSRLPAADSVARAQAAGAAEPAAAVSRQLAEEGIERSEPWSPSRAGDSEWATPDVRAEGLGIPGRQVSSELLEKVAAAAEQAKQHMTLQMEEFAKQVDPIHESLNELKDVRLVCADLQLEVETLKKHLESVAQQTEDLSTGASRGKKRRDSSDKALGSYMARTGAAAAKQSARRERSSSSGPQEPRSARSEHDAPQMEPLLDVFMESSAPNPEEPSAAERIMRQFSSPRNSLQSGVTPLERKAEDAQPGLTHHVSSEIEIEAKTIEMIDSAKKDAVAAATDHLMQNLSLDKSANPLERLVALMHERLRALDLDYRGTSTKFSQKFAGFEELLKHHFAEDRKRMNLWELDHQVDVIQSLCAEEMRHVKQELINDMSRMKPVARQSVAGQASERGDRMSISMSKMGSSGGFGASLEPFGEKPSMSSKTNADISVEGLQELKDMRDKVRRLQECYHNNTLKIAGLKAGTRTIELHASSSIDRTGKLAQSVEQLTDQLTRLEVRMDYLSSSVPGLVQSVESGGQPANAEDRPTTEPSSPGMPRQLSGPLQKRRHSMIDKTLSLVTPQSAGAESSPASPMKSVRRRGNQAALQQLVDLDPSSPTGELLLEGEGEVTLPRFLKLAKKVTLLDENLMEKYRSMHEELSLTNKRLGMMEAFLPKRQRRMVQRLLRIEMNPLGSQEDAAEPDVEQNAADQQDVLQKGLVKKAVSFKKGTDLVQMMNYRVDAEEEFEVPWQFAGESPVKWHWCSKQLNEMGRPLAFYLETMEHQREQWEADMVEKIRSQNDEVALRLGKILRRSKLDKNGRRISGVTRRSSVEGIDVPFDDLEEGALEIMEDDGPYGDSPPGSPGLSRRPPAGADARMDKVVLPMLTEFDERLGRIAGDVQILKKEVASLLQDKVGNPQFETLVVRVAQIELGLPDKMDERLQNLETTTKYLEQYSEKLSVQFQVSQNAMAGKNEITKMWQEISGLRVESQKAQTSVKQLTDQTVSSNQRVALKMTDINKIIDEQAEILQKDKANAKDLLALEERVSNIDSMLKRERMDLGKARGDDVNVVIKRIILGMEDKLMLLEQKVSQVSSPHSPSGARAEALQPFKRAPPPYSGADAEETDSTNDIDSIMQALQQLEHDVVSCKVDIKRVDQQFQEQHDLASRLRVSVHGADEQGESGGDAATLSLNRVHLMIAAAARQLVAGSKWVTKEIFDHRLSEMRREYQGNARQLQEQVGEMLVASPSNVKALPAIPPIKKAQAVVLPGSQGIVSQPDGIPLPGQALPLVRPSPRKLVAASERSSSRPWQGSPLSP